MAFLKERKSILAIEQERGSNVGQFNFNSSKRARRETISDNVPNISTEDFIFLAHLCAILKIFDEETKKVEFLKYFLLINL
jgi:hypothetical protein